MVREPVPSDLPTCAGWIAELPLWRRYGLTAAGAEGILRSAPRSLVAGGADGVIAFDPAGGFGRSGYVRLLGVRATSQGRGLGSALLAAAEREVFGEPGRRAGGDAGGASGMLVLCADFNAGARAFYARAGYREVGAIPGFVLPGVAEVILWKPRPPARRGHPG